MEKVLSEVLQGSVISPTLFPIFINDLGKSLIWSNYSFNTNDAVFYSSCLGTEDDTTLTHIKFSICNCKCNHYS